MPLYYGINCSSSEYELQAHAQIMKLHVPSREVMMEGNGGMFVSAECSSHIYSSNHQAVALIDGGKSASCQEW